MSSERTQRRDRQRTAQELNVLEYARALEKLAHIYSRFEEPTYKLRDFALAQLKSSKVKQSLIRKALSSSPLELSEHAGIPSRVSGDLTGECVKWPGSGSSSFARQPRGWEQASTAGF